MVVEDRAGAVEGDRHTQLLRGALDMCLLALLSQEATHGYDLVRRLEATGFEAVSYGTIYPLLTRMRRLGLVADEVQSSPSGPRRKVYTLTDDGHARLSAWRRQWTRFVDTVNTTLAGTTDSTRS